MAEQAGSPGASPDTSSGFTAAARICSLVAARALVVPSHVTAVVEDRWRERESQIQARSRDDNEATARAHTGARAGGRLSSFRCECGDEGCTCHIQLTLAEYESVRAYATHFVIARDHENPESEHVIEEHKRFAVVATVSAEAAKLARRSYPRQWRNRR